MHRTRVAIKKCTKCQAEKPLGEFGRDASRPDGRYSYCKQCRRKPNRLEIEIEELASKGLKKCSRCFTVKPFGAFDSDTSKRLGVTSRCKKCKQEDRKAKAANWHSDKAAMKELNDSGLSRCYRCKTVKLFHEFLKTNRSKTGITNLCLDCNNSIHRSYRRIRRKATRDYVRWEVFEDDNFTCYICEDILSPDTPGTDLKSLSIDHVVPVSRGGLDERDNVRTACLDCNRRKNDSMLEDFLGRLAM